MTSRPLVRWPAIGWLATQLACASPNIATPDADAAVEPIQGRDGGGDGHPDAGSIDTDGSADDAGGSTESPDAGEEMAGPDGGDAPPGPDAAPEGDADAGTCAPGSHRGALGGCVDEDRCAAVPSPCDAVPQAACSSRDGALSCLCPEGFGGDGLGETGCVPFLLDLAISPSQLATPFDPTVTEYAARVTPWATTLSWRTSAPEGATVRVRGESVLGGTWSELPLPPGDQDAPIVVSAGGAERTYQVHLERGARSHYVKPIDPTTESVFGYAVAMDGDLLVVSAPRESSNGASRTDVSAPGAGAVYVFRRDASGTYREEAYIKPNPVIAGANFGNSLSLQGSRLVIGAPNDSADAGNRSVGNVVPYAGAVYLYERDENGAWREVAYLKAPSPLKGELFGNRVSLDGDLLAVGAPRESWTGAALTNTVRDAGTAYVYHRQEGGGWSLEAQINGANTEAWDEFGYAVSLSGTRLAVSADEEDSGATRTSNGLSTSGAVYVFDRNSDGSWSESAFLKPQVVRANMLFGYALSLRGDRLAIGAPREASNGTSPTDTSTPSAGAAYLFERQANGSFAQVQYFKGSPAGGQEYFGRALALDETGTLLAIGADQFHSAVSAGRGQVSVRQLGADGWTEVLWTESENADATDQFGYSVAVSEGRVAVGARAEDSNSGSAPENNAVADSGAAYVLE